LRIALVELLAHENVVEVLVVRFSHHNLPSADV
jgi:hypothetical protein